MSSSDDPGAMSPEEIAKMNSDMAAHEAWLAWQDAELDADMAADEARWCKQYHKSTYPGYHAAEDADFDLHSELRSESDDGHDGLSADEVECEHGDETAGASDWADIQFGRDGIVPTPNGTKWIE